MSGPSHLEQACVSAHLAAPAPSVWPFLRWESLETMLPGGFFAAVDYDERRPVPGATRTITLGDGRRVRERLESVSAADMTYTYRLIEFADFPLAEYVGQVELKAAGEGASTVRFSCAFKTRGITADAWREIYRAMQVANIAFIRASVEGARPSDGAPMS